MDRITPIDLQRSFWNRWNTFYHKERLDTVSRREAEVVCGWLDSLGRKDLDILEVGCGSGWFCSELTRFGRVTGTDLSDEGLARARDRVPAATFVAGDFMNLELGANSFDVIVTLEVLAHVADQSAFVRKLASHLRLGGHLMLATQNRFVLQYLNRIPPPAPGHLRRWVDRRELRDLLQPEFEVLELFSVTPRVARETMARLRDSKALNWRVRAAVGDPMEKPARKAADQVGFTTRPRRWLIQRLEAVGLGWTLMVLARRPMAAGDNASSCFATSDGLGITS